MLFDGLSFLPDSFHAIAPVVFVKLVDKLWNDQYNMVIFWNERYRMARAKAFDLEKAQLQAMQLFWRKGYTATSVEDLTEALRLSRSSLYDTFGDKRTLFLMVLKRYSERVINRVARVLNESSSPIVAIQTLFDELVAEAQTETGYLGCFMVNSIAELVPYDAEVTKIAAAYTETLQRLLTEKLTQAVMPNTVTSEQTPAQLATYIFNTIQGMRVLVKTGATREQLQAISSITLRSLQ
jgi:TetR/AcrR family transcriptional repressor of nem operon